MNSNATIKHLSEILLHDWDPIGINDEVVVRDEYDPYAAEISRMLASGASASELAQYLVRIETEGLGLRARPERARAVAQTLKSTQPIEL